MIFGSTYEPVMISGSVSITSSVVVFPYISVSFARMLSEPVDPNGRVISSGFAMRSVMRTVTVALSQSVSVRSHIWYSKVYVPAGVFSGMIHFPVTGSMLKSVNPSDARRIFTLPVFAHAHENESLASESIEPVAPKGRITESFLATTFMRVRVKSSIMKRCMV